MLTSVPLAEVRSTHRLIVEHVNKIRQDNLLLRDATAVMILESNLAFESQHILHALGEAGVKKWLALAEGPGGSLDLLTTAGRKEEYTLLLREAMRMSKISLAETFFSISMSKGAYLKKLNEELLNFSCITEEPKTTFGKSRKTYTGKLAGKQDDTVLSMQMALYGVRQFFQNPKYNSYRIPSAPTPISAGPRVGASHPSWL